MIGNSAGGRNMARRGGGTAGHHGNGLGSVDDTNF
jgi:hypothetical protein